MTALTAGLTWPNQYPERSEEFHKNPGLGPSRFPFPMDATAQTLARLFAELQDVNHKVDILMSKNQRHQKTWLEPRELAAQLNVSTRTIINWRQTGKITEDSWRQTKRGYQYNANKIFVDIENNP